MFKIFVIRKNKYPTHSGECQYRRQDEQPATFRRCIAQAWQTKGQLRTVLLCANNIKKVLNISMYTHGECNSVFKR